MCLVQAHSLRCIATCGALRCIATCCAGSESCSSAHPVGIRQWLLPHCLLYQRVSPSTHAANVACDQPSICAAAIIRNSAQTQACRHCGHCCRPGAPCTSRPMHAHTSPSQPARTPPPATAQTASKSPSPPALLLQPTAPIIPKPRQLVSEAPAFLAPHRWPLPQQHPNRPCPRRRRAPCGSSPSPRSATASITHTLPHGGESMRLRWPRGQAGCRPVTPHPCCLPSRILQVGAPQRRRKPADWRGRPTQCTKSSPHRRARCRIQSTAHQTPPQLHGGAIHGLSGSGGAASARNAL